VKERENGVWPGPRSLSFHLKPRAGFQQPRDILSNKKTQGLLFSSLPMLLPHQEIQLPADFEQQSPSEYLEALYQFVEKYRWLADLYVGDFITMKLWERLDPTWRQALLPDSFDSEEDYQAWFASILSLTKSDYCDVRALKKKH
jgi:hypothetical protein